MVFTFLHKKYQYALCKNHSKKQGRLQILHLNLQILLRVILDLQPVDLKI